MALIAGSYERFIWGFSLKTLNPNTSATSSSETLALAPLFSYASHSGPIRCCAAAPQAGLAASGGADDTVRLYDLPSAADLGPLFDPSAAVSALAFYSRGTLPRNLLAACDDGIVHLYDADGFTPLAALRAFPRADAVTGLAVHPSGRVALAVGRAGGLAMLNLVRGRRSFACRLERPASAVSYAEDGSESGDRFVMAAEEKVSVHDSVDARILYELDCGKRVLCLAPAKNGILYTGGEDRAITAWDLSSGKVSSHIQDAHSARVKGLVVFNNQNDSSELCNLIASASSDGVIRVWDVRMMRTEKPTPLAEAYTKARLTCLAGTSLKCGTPEKHHIRLVK